MFIVALFLIAASFNCLAECPPCTNQTSNLSIPLPEDSLPYRVTIEQADFNLPAGIHSFAYAVHDGEWLLISGRTNGLHNVDNIDPNVNPFPPSQQNTFVFVINPKTKATYFRSLHDPSSHLSQHQIDLLSASNTLFYYAENKNTLYLVGGYGIDTASNTMGTKASLTAIDIPHLIKWVKHPSKSKSAAKCIRTIYHPIFQLTGGVMLQSNEHQPFLLAFGQNFDGNYTISTDGTYSRQVRPVQIIDNGRDLFVQLYPQPDPLPDYRRRDLNVIPIVKKKGESFSMSFSALSGVFTPADINNTPGAWTIPIEIDPDGSSRMLDPHDPHTFAQAMNNYSCANMGLYSIKKKKMYTLLFGGISASLFSDGSNCNMDPNPQCNCCTAWVQAKGNIFTPCCNLPFSNDVTTIEIDKHGVYQQYIMSGTFPIINSFPPVCPGFPPLACGAGPLQTIYYFGTNAAFIPAEGLPTFPNGVISFDKLGKKPVVVGYIIGGIASTISDTNCTTDTQASFYVFKVTLLPK
ncbi:MAG: hypothetical protein JSS10_05185 [Verrucomicrobia bacterium]|nr:hypothetical protein [Verrucomicrobiota bacterium]